MYLNGQNFGVMISEYSMACLRSKCRIKSEPAFVAGVATGASEPVAGRGGTERNVRAGVKSVGMTAASTVGKECCVASGADRPGRSAGAAGVTTRPDGLRRLDKVSFGPMKPTIATMIRGSNHSMTKRYYKVRFTFSMPLMWLTLSSSAFRLAVSDT